MADMITVNEFGFDPDVLSGIVKWGTVRCIEAEEKEVGARIGDLYIMTDIYSGDTVGVDLTKICNYIGMIQGSIIPAARYYYYRSKTNAQIIAKENKQKHPIQPLIVDHNNVIRFKANEIVLKLLNDGPFTMNDLYIGFSDEDKMQFAQLIGYSLNGFGTLSYTDNETYETAHDMYAKGMTEQDARNAYHEDILDATREKIKEVVLLLFNVNPNDLTS